MPYKVISDEQRDLLVTFMEHNRDIAKGVHPKGPLIRRIMAQRWERLAYQLNSVGTGKTKSTNEWRHYWRDLKYQTRKKALARQKLSKEEERVMALLYGIKNVVNSEIPKEEPQPMRCMPISELLSQTVQGTTDGLEEISEMVIPQAVSPAHSTTLNSPTEEAPLDEPTTTATNSVLRVSTESPMQEHFTTSALTCSPPLSPVFQRATRTLSDAATQVSTRWNVGQIDKQMTGDKQMQAIERQAQACEHQAQACERQAQACERQAQACERQAQACERQAQAYNRLAQAIDRQTQSFEREMQGNRKLVGLIQSLTNATAQLTKSLENNIANE